MEDGEGDGSEGEEREKEDERGEKESEKEGFVVGVVEGRVEENRGCGGGVAEVEAEEGDDVVGLGGSEGVEEGAV